ncbi:MAG: hypothetical protein ACRCZ5_09660, partial [Burkholderiales bacterium]
GSAGIEAATTLVVHEANRTMLLYVYLAVTVFCLITFRSWRATVVALVRAFAGSPKILFADEPTGNLDFATGRQISDLLFSLNRQLGTTLVLVTHDQQLAARCGRQIRLHGGELVTETS